MNISKKNTEAEWFKFPGKNKIEFKIRPYRFSIMKPEDVFELQLQQFLASVVDWKGLNDDDNKPFECNEENKVHMYDFYDDVRYFVSEKQNVLREKISKQLKN